jgi:cysteine desulfurase
VGFGAAAALALAELDGEGRRLAKLRDLLLSLLRTLPVRVSVNGGAAAKLPGTANVAFEGIDAEALLARLPDIALSTGSACASAVPGPSPVLLAMGQDEDRASSAVRFSLGRFTTADDISYAVGRIRAETAALIELGA